LQNVLLVQSIESAFSVPFCNLAHASFLFCPECLYRSMQTPISSPYTLIWTALIWVCAATGGDIALINKPTFSWDQQLVHGWSALSSGQSVPTCTSVVLVSVSHSAYLFLSLSLSFTCQV